MTHIKGHTNVLQPFGRHKFNFLNQKGAGTWHTLVRRFCPRHEGFPSTPPHFIADSKAILPQKAWELGKWLVK